MESLIYWRDVKKSGVVFGIGLAILLCMSMFSLISVFSYLSLLTLAGTVAFRIYKTIMGAVQKTSEGHPFKWVYFFKNHKIRWDTLEYSFIFVISFKFEDQDKRHILNQLRMEWSITSRIQLKHSSSILPSFTDLYHRLLLSTQYFVFSGSSWTLIWHCHLKRSSRLLVSLSHTSMHTPLNCAVFSSLRTWSTHSNSDCSCIFWPTLEQSSTEWPSSFLVSIPIKIINLKSNH